MKRLLAPFALLLSTGLVGVPLVAQNTQMTQQPTHVITDEDMQQRYHNDTTASDTTDSSTTTDQTDKNTQTTDQSDQGNDLDSLKKQLAKKQKELEGVKGSLRALQEFKDSTQKKLDATSDGDYKTELQNQLDDNAKDTATSEAKQKQLEKEIADLNDQIKDAEANNADTTTDKTSNEKTDNNTETNSNTENKNPPQNTDKQNTENPQR